MGIKLMWAQLDYLPEALLDAGAKDLQSILGGPTLIHLEGVEKHPLFISVLLHGNETVGWDAARQLLNKYKDTKLPRAISLYIGNVSAAEQGVRCLSDQPDYNRIWPGGELPTCPESEMSQKIVDIMTAKKAFVAVDVHNNTGLNPHYACVNFLDNHSLHLASLFGRTVVYFIRPTGVASQAMSTVCPSVTLECGKVGDASGLQHAVDYLDACLHLKALPDRPVAEHDLDIYHTIAIVKVPPEISISFDGSNADIRFVQGLEFLNFSELDVGTELAKKSAEGYLQVINEQGNDVRDSILSCDKGSVTLRSQLMPAMLTTNEDVIRQDCLCYLMERYR
jgi:hypothetical protein